MRALWKGAVAFGLVNVPVKMYAATEDHDVRFHQVHAEDGGRIRLKRECEVCHRQLSYSEIAKGYEDPSGQRIIIDPEDLEGLPVPGGRDIDVVEFVPSEQIDPVLFDRCYYLEPEGRAAKPYVLLREALRSTDRTAIVKVAIRQRTQLAALRIRDDVLVLQTMLWPDEVREADFEFLDHQPEIRKQELAMAESLIESMAADFEPSEFTDDYREALLALIDAKLSGGEGIIAPPAEEAADTGQVVDLMAALRESVARSQAARNAGNGKDDKSAPESEREPTPEAEVDVREEPAKKPAARRTTKKAPAKTAAKTTTRTASRTATKTAAKAPAKRKRPA